YYEIDKGHGRIEQRYIWVSDELKGYIDFPYAEQVFVNLLNNARDAIGTDGAISITTRLDEGNIIPATIDAVKSSATLEEIMNTTRAALGYSRNPFNVRSDIPPFA
ncbi:MAG: hypothetical protein B1H11_12320, partial [Desulfobacteraceae bacterium 4484_190.1]